MKGREGQTAVMGKAGCPRGAWECMDALGSAPRSLRTSPGTEEGSDEHLGLQGPGVECCWDAGYTVAARSPSRVRLFVTPWTAARQASLPLTIS